MLWLKQSTVVTVKIGPFVDEDDGKTAETGLTISQADVRLSMNGGNIAQKTESTACTHDELGIYGCPLDATDTGTLGRLQLWVHESGALPVWHEFMVVPANVWDSMFGADKLQVDATQIEGGDATDAINAAVDAALDTAIPGSPTANSINERIAAIDDLTQASGDGDLAAILADTGELQTDDVPGLIAALENLSAAEVNTQVDAALNTAIPGSPTADSINQRVAAVDDLTQASGAGDLAAILADTGGGVALADGAITAAKIATNAITAAKIAADAIGASELATDAVAAIAAAVHLAGAGAITFTYTLTLAADSSAIADADVWVTSDEAGNTLVASGETDENGQVVFYLDAGDYYVWAQKAGYNFSNPDKETVS